MEPLDERTMQTGKLYNIFVAPHRGQLVGRCMANKDRSGYCVVRVESPGQFLGQTLVFGEYSVVSEVNDNDLGLAADISTNPVSGGPTEDHPA